MVLVGNSKVDALPLSPKSFPLPAVTRAFPGKFRYRGVGGAVQDGTVPIICGGDTGGGKRVDTCYRYSPKARTWTQSGRLSHAKDAMAASLHPEFGLVITGGYNGKIYDTVESTRDGKHFTRSIWPSLPEANHAHCQVTVDPNIIMVFGGCTPSNCNSDTSLKLNIAEKKWKKLPKLPAGRYGPACGVIKERGVAKRVLVAGGHTKGGITDNVVVLELSTLTWTNGELFTRS